MKNRLLVTISFSFSIRYLYRSGLLYKLRSFAEPVIALTWNQADLVEELKNDGFEVHLVPESFWEPAYEAVRAKIDFWFYRFQSKTPSYQIQRKYLSQFDAPKKRWKKALREKYELFIARLPGRAAKLFSIEQQLYRSATNYKQMAALVERLNIDAVFTVTPFHRQEDVLLRACRDAGKKMFTAILSFDNVTKRGWLPVNYNVYLVWNKYNEQELKRIYPNATQQAKVVVTGAAQFDFYFDTSNLQDKIEWKRQLGISDDTRKIILYAGGPKSLLPQEPMFLKAINEAISNGSIAGKPVVLFRCHPIDNIERWKVAIGPTENVIYETSWTGTGRLQNANLTNADMIKLCSNLAHTDVHVNVSSTMTVDGSAYNKPQIGPAYDEVPSKSRLLQSMYYQEHFIPIVRTGGLKMAKSKEELIASINDALANPDHYIQRSNQILSEIITFTDGGSTQRVADELKKAMQVS